MEFYILILVIIVVAELSYVAVQQKNHQPPKQLKNNLRPIFVDTSVLIDGRILAVARSGFITDTLVIPRSVIGELQFLADNGDHDKRTRARYGLDLVRELQALDSVKTEILQDGSRAVDGVDNQLLSLAKQYSGVICTIDYNLNKVANVEGLTVLNVNDLAMSLRMAYLPGERMMLEITQKGNEQHQGVGHLPDGTMVVVEQAGSMVSKQVEIEFIRSLQTAAGKMMFAKLTSTKNIKGGDSTKPTEGKFDKPRTNKPTGTKYSKQPSRPQAQPKPEEPVVKAVEPVAATVPATQAATQPRNGRNNSRRRNGNDHEDNLIKLVNNQ